MRILIFGASITHGHFDTMGGWATRIMVHYQQEFLHNPEQERVVVFPLGVFGNNASDVLERIESETESRRYDEDEECIVLSVGMNDSKLIDNRAVMEEYTFQKTYEELIDTALSLCPRVICVGINSVNEEVANVDSSRTLHNNRINLFEDIIKQSAELKEVAFVPIHDAFLEATSQTELLADGVHPNSAGHAFIAGKVQEAIEALR